MRTLIFATLFVAATLALAGASASTASKTAARAGSIPQPDAAEPSQQTPPATTSATASAQDTDEQERVTIRLVRLPGTVLDKKEQPVTGLTANDFIILEDKKPQQIESFIDERERLPIYVGVLMDTSSSTAGKL